MSQLPNLLANLGAVLVRNRVVILPDNLPYNLYIAPLFNLLIIRADNLLVNRLSGHQDSPHVNPIDFLPLSLFEDLLANLRVSHLRLQRKLRQFNQLLLHLGIPLLSLNQLGNHHGHRRSSHQNSR